MNATQASFSAWLITALIVSGSARRAYAQAPTSPGRARAERTSRTGVRAARGPSLADILEKMDWDPAARGALLIVAPEETTHAGVPRQPMTAEEFRLAQEAPEAEANGSYRLSRLEDYYSRRLINLPTLTVFAPATMAVLNTTHLPKPDAYAGISNADKARLLQSTFTPDQWRQIGSPEGIGAGDLKSQQRDIFLSMLPDPFIVVPPSVPTVDDAGITRQTPASPITLTADQRANVRFSLARKLDWSFKTGTNGRMSVGSGDPNAMQKLRLQTQPMRFEATSDVFGVKLVDDVPSHAKPSQLPSNWEALEKQIDLGNAATVGDLVKAIAKQTGAGLYCDPRYEDLKLYARGASAQAGDLCKALALAVTGTWRRLGEAFVLTDDLVGLGARHALIDNWIRQNVLLAQIRSQQVDDALAKSHLEDYIGWAANDPLKPNDALSGKIDAYQKETPPDRAWSLFVPTAELSPAAQDQIKDQIAQQEASQQRRKEQFPNMREQEPIKLGGVYLSLGLQPTFDIPGVGSVNADEFGSWMGPQMKMGVASGAGRANRSRQSAVASAPPIAFPTTLPDRAVLIAASPAADVAKLAQDAHLRGFTQLWVESKPGDTEALKAAVQAGAANGLVVQAVMPLTRPAPAGKPDLQDRNVLGETLSGYAKRWRSQLGDLRLPEEASPNSNIVHYGSEEPIRVWGDSAAVERILRGGDFLRCDDPAAIDEKSSEVGTVAAVPGLGGIVFTDIAAPGYNAPLAPGVFFGSSTSNPGSDPLLSMGYNDSTRLACLLKNGFDPVDLSPLPGGDRINLPFYVHRSGQPPQITLPFFPDYGPSARNTTFNGQSRVTQGAKDAWERWSAFRQDLDAKFVTTIADAAHARSPKITVMALRSMAPLDNNPVYFGSLDGPPASANSPTDAGAAAPPKPGQPTRSRDILRDAARAGSRVGYMSLKYDETPGVDEAKRRFIGSLPYMMQNSAEWEGIVFDLRDATTARVLELLTAFPPAPAMRATPN